MEEQKKQKWLDKLKKTKGFELILVGIAAVVIVVILFGSFSGTSKKTATAEFSAEAYVADLESRLSKTLAEIRGAGKTKVLITVSSGMQTVTATESTVTQNGGTTQTTEKPILVNGKPLVLMEKYPEIAGVVIVSEGADNLKVRLELSRAAASVLNIDEKKVEIFVMK